MTIVLALALLLVASVADAQTRWQQCLATKSCRAEVETVIDLAVTEAEATWRAALPCTAFARSAAEAGAFVGQAGTVCVVVESVERCGSDYCAKWERGAE